MLLFRSSAVFFALSGETRNEAHVIHSQQGQKLWEEILYICGLTFIDAAGYSLPALY